MADREEILDALHTIDAVGLPRDFDRLVSEGASGGESHSITGDDLASLCLAFKSLFKHFGYDHTMKWSYIQEQPNLRNYDV